MLTSSDEQMICALICLGDEEDLALLLNTLDSLQGSRDKPGVPLQKLVPNEKLSRTIVL